MLWRLNRRRLDFEAMRDSLLAVVGPARPDDRRPPVDRSRLPCIAAADGLRLHRPAEPAGLFRTFDFASPDATEPAAARDDGAAAGAVPDEQPVRRSSRPRPWPPAPDSLAETRHGRAHRAASIRLLFGRPAEPREVELARSLHRSRRLPTRGRRSKDKLSPWEQYAQVLLRDERVRVYRLKAISAMSPTTMRHGSRTHLHTRREMLCRVRHGLRLLGLAGLLADAGLARQPAQAARRTAAQPAGAARRRTSRRRPSASSTCS